MTTQVRQGDQYSIPFYLTRTVNGTEVVIDDDPINFNNMSITLGPLTKRYDAGQGEVSYDPTNQVWLFPLSQAETYSLKEGRYNVEIRIKWTATTGQVAPIESIGIQPIEILKALDRRML